MKCELMVPKTLPASCARQYGKISERAIPPDKESARVTTGLKCAPEILPNAQINVTSAAPVAIELNKQRDRCVAARETFAHDPRADHGR